MLQTSALAGHADSKGHKMCLKQAENAGSQAQQPEQTTWESTTPSLERFMMAAAVVGRHDSFEDTFVVYSNEYKPKAKSERGIVSVLLAGLSTVLQVANSGD